MITTSKIAVVIPALNESLTIGEIILDLDLKSVDAIVVDDGSADDTAKIAREAGAKVLQLPQNSGNGAALRAGIEYALDQNHNVIVTIDGDGAHKTQDIKRVIEAHSDAQADLTIGSRFMLPNNLHKIPTPKIAANKFAVGLFNKIFSTSKTDVASGFRVFGSKASRFLATDTSFAWTFEFLSHCIDNGLRVCESPIGVRYDAQELWATSIKELKDFLAFCSRERESFKEPILKLIMALEKGETCSVKIANDWLFLHPITSTSAVLFQLQNSWHSSTPLNITCIDFEKYT